MLDTARVHVASPGPWPVIGLGIGGGVLAAMLLVFLVSPLNAALSLAGVGVGLLTVAFPQLGLYLLTSSTIVAWPGNLLKFAGALVAGSTVFWALAHGRSLVPRDRLLLMLGLLVGVVWISVLRVGGGDAVSEALGFTGYAVLYWSVSTLANAPAVARRMAGGMLWSGMAVALVGLVQFRFPFFWIVSATAWGSTAAVFQGASAVDLQSWDGAFRIDSVTGTPDYLGLSMQALLPFAVFWTVAQRTLLRRVVGLAIIFALLAALVLSFTRGVMFSTALIVVPMLVIKLGWRRTMPAILIGTVLLIAISIMWDPLRTRIVSVVLEWIVGGEDTAGGWRREVLGVGVRMFADHFLLGVGIGQQPTLWRAYAPSSIMPPGLESLLPMHNAYFLIGIELGVAGLGLVVLLIGTTWRRLRQLQADFRASGQQSLLSLAHAAEVTWVALAFNLAFYPVFNTSYLYFWVVLAFVGALSRVAADQRDVRRQTAVPLG